MPIEAQQSRAKDQKTRKSRLSRALITAERKDYYGPYCPQLKGLYDNTWGWVRQKCLKSLRGGFGIRASYQGTTVPSCGTRSRRIHANDLRHCPCLCAARLKKDRPCILEILQLAITGQYATPIVQQRLQQEGTKTYATKSRTIRSTEVHHVRDEKDQT